MEKKIKILLSVSSLGIGGTETFVMNFYRHINRESFQIDFIIYSDRLDFYDEVNASGSKIYVSPVQSRNKLIKLLRNMLYVYQVVRKGNYHAVHCNGCSFVTILNAALPSKMIKGTRTIVHAHSASERDRNPLGFTIKEILKAGLSRMADVGIACSNPAGRAKFTKKFMLSDKYMVMHNAVDMEHFKYNISKRKTCRERLGVDNKILIGAVGRLEEEKNHEFLLDALYHLLKMNVRASLLLVGGGSLCDKLRMKAEELQISDNVLFVGSVKDTSEYYSAMDIFVMPSIYEGLPFSLIEAQVNSLPCLVSDTITREAECTKRVFYKSLKDGAHDWARKLVDIINMDLDRNLSSDSDIRDHGFDISYEVKKLEKIYSTI